MTPSIQHYHGEVDFSAIEISLTHNCSHLTQAYFNLLFSRCTRLERFREDPSAFMSTSGCGRTFLYILDAFQSSLAASHLILFILAVSLEVPHFRVCCCKPLLFHLERLRSHYAYVKVPMLYGFNAFDRTVVYLLPSNKYRGRELHVILSIHSLYVGANGFLLDSRLHLIRFLRFQRPY